MHSFHVNAYTLIVTAYYNMQQFSVLLEEFSILRVMFRFYPTLFILIIIIFKKK